MDEVVMKLVASQSLLEELPKDALDRVRKKAVLRVSAASQATGERADADGRPNILRWVLER